ncbi:MAG: TPM domain-containing protein [bacterium]
MRKFSGLMILVMVSCSLFFSGRAALAAAPVEDGAKIFSQGAVAQVTDTARLIKEKTGKDLWVVTVDTRGDVSRKEAADKAFRERNGQGFMIFIAVKEKEFGLRIGDMTRRIFPASTVAQIKNALGSNFKAGDYDAGLIAAVGIVKETFRAASVKPGAVSSSARHGSAGSGGFNLMNALLLGGMILLGIFVVTRLIKALFGSFGGGGVQGGNAPAGVPGGGLGGGGFFSGLLGGLGGAFLGNAAYDMMRNSRHEGDSGMTNSGTSEGSQVDDAWKNQDSGGSSFSDDSGGWGGGGDIGGGDFGGGDGGW